MTPDDENEDSGEEKYEAREYPDESDLVDGQEPALIKCVYCGKMIHEDSEWCHHCGKFISAEDAPLTWRFWIFVAAVLIGVLLLFRR